MQCSSASAIYRLQENMSFCLDGEVFTYFELVWYLREIIRARSSLSGILCRVYW